MQAHLKSATTLFSSKNRLWKNLAESVVFLNELDSIDVPFENKRQYTDSHHSQHWLQYSDWCFLVYQAFVRPLLSDNNFLNEWSKFRFAEKIVFLCNSISCRIAPNYIIGDEFDIETSAPIVISEFSNMLTRFFNMFDSCQSPLEQAFLIGLAVDTGRSFLNWNDLTNPDIFDCQYSVDKYRIDFVIQSKKPEFKIAIEVDGHTYHEKTVEQAVGDRSRDRHLTRAGWLVVRFHSNEIRNGLSHCVFELGQQYRECKRPGSLERTRRYFERQKQRYFMNQKVVLRNEDSADGET
jgi:very-short-patch-repair endonuclease